MNIRVVDIALAESGQRTDIFLRIRHAMPASPLRLAAIEQVAADRWVCRFVPQRADAAVRWRSVLMLQNSLSQEFTILHVDSHVDPAAA